MRLRTIFVALVILKIFTSEFYSIGALYALYGTGILLTSLLRRQQGNKEFFSEVGDDGVTQKRFRTSGNVVVILTALSIAAYACLLGLTVSLKNWQSLLIVVLKKKLDHIVFIYIGTKRNASRNIQRICKNYHQIPPKNERFILRVQRWKIKKVFFSNIENLHCVK